MAVLTKAAFIIAGITSACSTSVLVAQTSTDVTRNDLRNRVSILADDSMFGRDAGQIGDMKATDYVARELRRIGLKPAGTDGFFQTIPLAIRAPVKDAMLSADGTRVPSNDFISVPAAGRQPVGGRFERTAVPSIYGGTLGGEMISGAQARGKVVVFGAPTQAIDLNATILLGSANSLTSYTDAAAVLVIGLDQFTQAAQNGMRTSRYVLHDSTTKTVPVAVITPQAARIILGEDYFELSPGAAGRKVSGRFGVEDRAVTFPARNVIGIIEGTDPTLRNEYVAIGAHTDNLGIGAAVDHDSVRIANGVWRPLGAMGQPRHATEHDITEITAQRDELKGKHAPRLDSIYNGADSDASGVAGALELAEYFAKNPTRRSLLFVFHTADEKALAGSRYFTENATINRGAIVSEINLDGISRGGPLDMEGSQSNTVYVVGAQRLATSLRDIIGRANTQQDHRMTLDDSFDQPGNSMNAFCRGDQAMYERYGIPSILITTGWHRDYHMVTDETQYINADMLLNVTTLTRDIVKLIAMGDARPLVDQARPDPNGVCRQ